MNVYLTIMVTVLVATQIIRITQNAIQLHRANLKLNKDIEWIKDVEISKADFEVQRAVYRLMYDKLIKECNEVEE